MIILYIMFIKYVFLYFEWIRKKFKNKIVIVRIVIDFLINFSVVFEYLRKKILNKFDIILKYNICDIS